MPRKPAHLSTVERVALVSDLATTTETPPSPNDDQVDLQQWQDESKLEQEIMLNLWEDWCEATVKDQSYQLQQGWTPPSHEELKKFIRWVIKASGHDLSLPSMRGIGIRISKFFSGVLRRTGYAFSEADKTELHDFIKHRLRRERVVTSETKPKLAFKRADQKNSLLVLWTEQDPGPTPRIGRERVMLTTALFLYCYTGARLGAIIPLDSTVEARNNRIEKKMQRIVRHSSNFSRTTSSDKDELTGLRWRDIEFTLIRRPAGPPELVFTLSQVWIKNNLGDKNNGLKTGLTHRDSLIQDPIPWLLALAFADSAFKKYENVEQLWAERVTSRRECLPLAWKEEKEDMHVFRPSLHSLSALNQKTFNRMFDLLMRQTGFTRRVSVQRIREEVTNVVDNANVTEAQRKHAVGHSKSVFNQSYIHSLSAIDIQALFLGESQRQDHLELLSSLSSVLVRGYPMKLPDDERDLALSADAKYQSLKRERDQTRLDLEARPDSPSLHAKRGEIKKKIDQLRYKIKNQALKVYQKKWLEESQADGTFMDDQPVADIKALRFAHLLRFAPNRLAVTAAVSGQCDYTHETRPALISCLTQMAQEHEIVLHRPGEVPVEGVCPVESCKVKLTGNFYDRQFHIHNCRRKEAEIDLWGVKYCFRCFKFFQREKEWEQHCDLHLADLPIDCAAVTWHESWQNRYCIQDGFCPFCACGSGSATARYRVFEKPRLLCSHVLSHVQSQRDWPAVCPHPRCPHVIPDQPAMNNHLEHHHGISGLHKLAATHAKTAPAAPSIVSTKRKCDLDSESAAKRSRSFSASSVWSSPTSDVADTGSLNIAVTLGNEPVEATFFTKTSPISAHNASPLWQSGFSAGQTMLAFDQSKTVFEPPKPTESGGLDFLDEFLDLDGSDRDSIGLPDWSSDELPLLELEGFEEC